MSEILKELQQRTLAAKERNHQTFRESVQTQVGAAIDACRKAADEGLDRVQFACTPLSVLVEAVVEELKRKGLTCRVMPRRHSKSAYAFIVISWSEAPAEVMAAGTTAVTELRPAAAAPAC